MILEKRFKRELQGFKILDNYIQKSSITGEDIEYMIVEIGGHYFAFSYLHYYVVTENDSPSRDAYAITPSKAFNRRTFIDYLRELRIKYEK